MQLTSSQREVIEFPYKPSSTLKVIAGPGSGKTVTLLHKIYHLVKTEKVRPDEILVLSLTNKALDNVIDKLLGVFEEYNTENQYTDHELQEIVGQIHVNTIHGLANRIVIENEGLVSIIEENGWRGLMKLLSQDLWKTHQSKLITPREFQKIFNEYKLDNNKQDEVMERLTKIMRDCQVFTNEDLIVSASDYLTNPTDRIDFSESQCFTKNLRDGFKIVLIDEFQDLFPSLVPLLEKVVKNKQLILFGDPNQSIYNFLGDNSSVIDKLDKVHTGANFNVVHLYDNFRCTPEIISVASNVVDHKMDFIKESTKKNLVLKLPSGVYPEFHEIEDPVDELEFLIEQTCMLVCSGVRLSDIAVLTRTNARVQITSDHLNSYGIPFQKLTAQPDWMSDPRVQFIIGLLRTVVLVKRGAFEELNPVMTKKSDFSVIITLGAIKGVSNQAIQSLFKVCNEKNVSFWNYITVTPKNEWPSAVTNRKKIESYTTTISHLMDTNVLEIDDPLKLLVKICEATSMLEFAPMTIKGEREAQEFKKNLHEMFKVMKMCALSKPPGSYLAEWFLESYVEQSAIQHHQDAQLQSGGLGAVNLSTVHSSKGLEFPIVFLIDDLSHFSMDQNLLYVGMTRARNLLYLNNIKHNSIATNKSVKKHNSLLLNGYFWNYYNRDLRRPAMYSIDDSVKRYEMLRKKYGFNSVGRRKLITWSYIQAMSSFKRLVR